jgi:DNA-binding HxlR family transcriptional regulator
MDKKSFEQMPCSIARGLDVVGEWWSILIIRDIMHGITKFDDFQKSLGIPPTTLTKRLNKLLEVGLLEKKQYLQRPPRFEYFLSESGRDFTPILAALVAWGNKHRSPNGIDTLLVDRKSKQQFEPVVVDKGTGELLTIENMQFCGGPATPQIKKAWLESLGMPLLPADPLN